MLENARRQALLVLITVVAGLLCNFSMSPALGLDLKGGAQLIYEIPQESIDRLTATERTTLDQVMEQTITIIQERADPTGVANVLVSRRGTNGILVELPYREPAELVAMKSQISSLGRLEMRIVANPDLPKFDMTQEKQRLETWLKSGGRELVLEDWKKIKLFNENPQSGPIAFGKLAWYPHKIEPSTDGKTWGQAFFNNNARDQGITPMGPSTVKVFEDTDYNGGVIPEAILKEENPFLLEFVAIDTEETFFRGEDLDPTGVSPGVSQGGGLSVNYQLKAELAGAYGDWSEAHIKEHSAIILNGMVRSAPYFRGRIPGRGEISGNFTQPEVDELVKVLRTGSLQVEPVLLSDKTVGPNIGQRALELGEFSLVIGGVAVFLFMLWYYRLAGIVASVCLLLNLFLLWSSLLFMQATITLPGLGGIVLTMGMAVDANVLIYERIREEFDRGKDLLRAVRAGFERAMSAILDSNITTFLTGLVLYNVGVGPVRGFAVTLMVGIVMTVFTQFFVSRLLFHWLLVNKKLENFKVHRLFAQPNFNFLKPARICLVASIAVIGGGIYNAIAVVPSEISLDIDFKGGANMQMLLKEETTADFIRERLGSDEEFNRQFHNASVNRIDDELGSADKSTLFNIRIKLTDEMRAQIDADREVYRNARSEAERNNTAPPEPYKAPYVAHMERMFQDVLADAASEEPKVIEGVEEGSAWAQINLHFTKPVAVAAANAALQKAKLPSATAKAPGTEAAADSADLFIEWQTVPSTPKVELFDVVRDALAGLQDVEGNPAKLSNPFPEAEEIQGRMVGELRNAAIGALILSWGLIIFYLRVRFHEYKYGVAAVCALVHDVLVTLGVVVAFNAWGIVHAEINLNMIACFLTIIGYSVNDTIVIFDRIRENIREQGKTGGQSSFRQLINLSVNQTLSRTVLTTGLTMFVVLAQFAVNWGTDSDLESFAFGMMVGMISGTYSTIFIAAPVLVWIHDRSGGDKAMLEEQQAIREAEAQRLAEEAAAEQAEVQQP